MQKILLTHSFALQYGSRDASKNNNSTIVKYMSFRDIVIKQIEEKDAKENEIEALKEKQTKVETSLNNLSAQQEEMKRELNELNGQQKEMINILTAMTKKLADLTKKLPTKEDKMWFQLYFFHSGKLFMSQPKWNHFYAIQ